MIDGVENVPTLTVALIIVYIMLKEAVIPVLRNHIGNGTRNADHLIREVHEWLKPDDTGSQLWKGYTIKSKLDIIEKRIEEIEKYQSRMVDQIGRLADTMTWIVEPNLNLKHPEVHKSRKGTGQ